MEESSKLGIKESRIVLKKFDNNDPDPDKLPFEIMVIENDIIIDVLQTEHQIFDFMNNEKKVKDGVN